MDLAPVNKSFHVVYSHARVCGSRFSYLYPENHVVSSWSFSLSYLDLRIYTFDATFPKQNKTPLDWTELGKRKGNGSICVCVWGGGRQCLYGGVLKTPNMTISVKNVQPKGVATPYPTLIRPPYPTLIRPVSHFDPPPYPTLIRPVPHSDPPLRRERNRIRKKTETYIVAD